MLDRIIDVIYAIWHALIPWIVLQPYEAGVLVRLGKFKRVLGPGFHWVLPLHIDKVWDEHTTPSTHRIGGLSTTTKDGKAVGFDAIITYQIADVEKALLRVTQVKDAVLDTCMGVIGTALSDAAWDEILHGKVTDELTKLCARRGRKWGIEILSVQLAGACLVKNIRLVGGQHSVEVEHSV